MEVVVMPEPENDLPDPAEEKRVELPVEETPDVVTYEQAVPETPVDPENPGQPVDTAQDRHYGETEATAPE